MSNAILPKAEARIFAKAQRLMDRSKVSDFALHKDGSGFDVSGSALEAIDLVAKLANVSRDAIIRELLRIGLPVVTAKYSSKGGAL